jgi:hypothetical protein
VAQATTKHPYTAFPAYMWSPEGECRPFDKAEDVPDGWTDHHPNHFDGQKPPPPVKAAVPTPMTRDEIVAALDAGGIEFGKNTGTKALYDLLTKSVQKVLTDRSIPFDQNADTRVLLGLLPPPE